MLKQTMAAVCTMACWPILGSTISQADTPYPNGGSQHFRTEGFVSMVDADRDRVTVTTPDGRQYNLDTSDTSIKLRASSQPGTTGDLAAGMRVSVDGRLLAPGVVAAETMTVLPYTQAPNASPTPDLPSTGRPSTSSTDERLRLRGTIESVDDDAGIVVVHVLDHKRTIRIDHHTDLTDISNPDSRHIGVHPGQRITVRGVLRPDGSIKADAISLSADIDAAKPGASVYQPVEPASNTDLAVPSPDQEQGQGNGSPDTDDLHQIVGRVTGESDKPASRDIKVQLESNRSVTVHVLRDVPITRDGRSISVHDLTGDDIVRIVGSFDGDDFVATRIDVLQTYMDGQ